MSPWRAFFLHSSRESEQLNIVTNLKDSEFYARAYIKSMRALFTQKSAPNVADDKASLASSYDLER